MISLDNYDYYSQDKIETEGKYLDVETKIQLVENETIYYIDGYPCHSIIDDYNWYRQNGRPKDLASADKIDTMFEKIAKEYNCKAEEVTENEICKYINK